MLLKFLNGKVDLLKETHNTQVISKMAITESSDYENLRLDVLMYQAGYLTLKGQTFDSFQVGFPNAEVRTSLMQFYTTQLLSGRSLGEVGVPSLLESLILGNVEKFLGEVNRALLGIDYTKYPLQDEASVRAAVQMFLCGMGLTAQPEVHNALGRSDLEFDLGENHWVLEFKYATTEKEADAKLKEALDQIEERRYGEHSQKKLMRYALVFAGDTKQISKFAWK